MARLEVEEVVSVEQVEGRLERYLMKHRLGFFFAFRTSSPGRSLLGRRYRSGARLAGRHTAD